MQIISLILNVLEPNQKKKNNYFPIFLYLQGENEFVYSNKILPFNMKSTNLIKKYAHITESYVCPQ